MTDSTPVGRVAEALEDAGYQRIASGLQVGELKFQFPAAFVKAKSTAELVLVADSASESEMQLTRKVDGVARALDIASSTRSLTLVVTGPRPSTAALESLGRVCRVLPTGNITGTTATKSSRTGWLCCCRCRCLSPSPQWATPWPASTLLQRAWARAPGG